jgi:hypothetical protein
LEAYKKAECYNRRMQEYTFNVTMQVTLLAFSADDAKEIITEGIEDLGSGAEVTNLLVDLAADKS